MELSTPIKDLARVGPQYQKKLKKLGIKTIKDLIFHFPKRYEDFSNIKPISQIKSGEIVCVQGKIKDIENTFTWKRRMTLTQAIVEDKTGSIKVVWFNQPYLVNTLKKNNSVCLAGKTTTGKDGLYLSNPSYEKITANLTHTGRLVPVYPETEGLSSKWLRFIIKPVLLQLTGKILDPLPEIIRQKYNFLAISKAVWQIHFPDSQDLAKKAQDRFFFEELFYIQIFVLMERMKLAREKANPITIKLKEIKKLISSLSFELTAAQKKATWQILKDLEKPRPMNRLLDGDVGSGKTIVAAIAGFNVIKNHTQCALMAPTEILAQQHFKTISEIFSKFKINLALLTGKENKFNNKKISRAKLLEKISDGQVDFLIGTQALIQDKVKFKNLALVILDEQHRFGVEQRAKLIQQTAKIPHLLSMTATPIPRTLTLTVYGDLDLSLIDEMPKGRKKIITKIIAPSQRQKAYDFIRKQVQQGRQIFVLCPRIESSKIPDTTYEIRNTKLSSWSDVKAVKEEYEKLSKEIFPDLKKEMLHGKMKTKEKEEIMNKFKQGKIDILVATSVIEVGIDVPNAAVMLIEGAERFGLAQLHQFRGRVGRSKEQSYCFLFTDSSARKTHQRLKALITSEDGFKLAEKDLAIRGPGDFSGKRQWGVPDLAMAGLKDIFLVEKTRQTAKEILIADPNLKKYPLLRDRIKKFRERIHLE